MLNRISIKIMASMVINSSPSKIKTILYNGDFL